VRFSWSLALDGGEPIVRGLDFALVADDGCLRAVTGFLEGGNEPPGQLAVVAVRSEMKQEEA